MVNTRERLSQVALERNLRRSTMLSYRRLLDGLGVLDSDPSKDEVLVARGVCS